MTVWFKSTIERNMVLLFSLAFTGLLVSLSDADVYLHNPRGSNNRLNGARTARANNNRLFDSQVSFKSLFIQLCDDMQSCSHFHLIN